MRQLSFTLSSIPCFASGLEKQEPGADVGLSAESMPVSQDIDIRKVTFKTTAGKPVIDGHIWEQAETFDLNIELYPERLAPAVVK